MRAKFFMCRGEGITQALREIAVSKGVQTRSTRGDTKSLFLLECLSTLFLLPGACRLSTPELLFH